ncbi:MAG: hypothetical protein AVDCRST_MAG93-9077 [uncultured Chloroflexia bacterium]|uniref:Uncharacterized protein n=1 Tax=uncultured Chloroflexia bacterium TaxID=1672391 RepID=A0A6J4NAB2_9CHLR|nr:MAG: hypothetical protein AVDCRST_MAG93-9077 [uncultured Chloroflexia bacterium]
MRDAGKGFIVQDAMHKICKCIWFFAHHAGSLCRLRVVMLAGLVVLLMAGCQDEGTPDGSDQAAVGDSGKTSDATGQTRRDGTSVDENDQTSDPRAQLLGLLTRLIENCDGTLSKLAHKQEDYASAGNEQGEREMAQAAENVQDIKDTGRAYRASLLSDEADGGSDNAMSEPQAAESPAGGSGMPEEINKLLGNFEDNLADAERCCGLPPDFVDSNLRSFRTQAASIEPLVEQIESERPTAQPESERPTAQPESERPTDQYTAQP